METSVKWVLGLGAVALGYTIWQARSGAKAKAATLASERTAGKIVGRRAHLNLYGGGLSNFKYTVTFDVVDPRSGLISRTWDTNKDVTIPTSTASTIWVDPPTLSQASLAGDAQSQAPADSAQAALINNEILRYVAQYPESVIFT